MDCNFINLIIMKYIRILILLCGIHAIIAFSCNKENEFECSTGKIIEITCGGTVVQFLVKEQIIGEEWNDNFSTPVLSYENCVLVGNLPIESCEKGDTLYFSYRIVKAFTSGNFCDIGGLPGTKIEVSELFDNRY